MGSLSMVMMMTSGMPSGRSLEGDIAVSRDSEDEEGYSLA